MTACDHRSARNELFAASEANLSFRSLSFALLFPHAHHQFSRRRVRPVKAAVYRLPPPAHHVPKKEPTRKRRAEAVERLRELQRREKEHKPVVDIPMPHIGHWSRGVVEDSAAAKKREEAVTKFRELQNKERDHMPLGIISLDDQWKQNLSVDLCRSMVWCDCITL